MLIGLLMALIFGGGAESEFATSIPHLNKEIRRHVEDKSREDTLLKLVKEYEKTINRYNKQKKKQFKALNKISPDREKTSEEFMTAYDAYYKSREELLSELIGYRLMFQEQITEEELLLLIEEAHLSSKKERRHDQKAEDKSEDKLARIFEDLNNIVLRHIEDSAKVGIVTQDLHAFESSLYAAVDESYQLEVERKLRLDDRNATREEIEEMYSQSNQLRYDTAKNFAELRQKVIDNTNEKEWKAINKELETFLKN